MSGGLPARLPDHQTGDEENNNSDSGGGSSPPEWTSRLRMRHHLSHFWNNNGLGALGADDGGAGAWRIDSEMLSALRAVEVNVACAA